MLSVSQDSVIHAISMLLLVKTYSNSSVLSTMLRTLIDRPLNGLMICMCLCLHAATCGSWTLSPDSSIRAGGKPMTGATTLHECHVACVNQEDCVGIDWKSTKSSGQNCWLLPMSAPRNIVADPGNSHFDFIRSSSCWRTYNAMQIK